MYKLSPDIQLDATPSERRLHRRMNVMKSALLFPVSEQMAFPIDNISHRGLAGISTRPLALRQCVHIGFNDSRFVEACVRWVDRLRVGLELKEPLLFAPDAAPVDDAATNLVPRSARIPVAMSSNLIVSRPYSHGIVRDISNAGMRIDTPTALEEGEQLLVQLTGRPAVLGRVQWHRRGSVGVQFHREVDLVALISNPNYIYI